MLLTALADRYWCWRARRRGLDRAVWERCRAQLPLFDNFPSAECDRLWRRSVQFLVTKQLWPVGGVEMTPPMRMIIALQASLPVLALGLRWYRGFSSVVLQPDEFHFRHEEMDEYGIVHEIDEAYEGLAWQNGAVVLSWSAVQESVLDTDCNLVVHEFAHQMDMLSGGANGCPPLHAGMSVDEWSRDFAAAYAAFSAEPHAPAHAFIDPYAAEAPEEFFAVLSEVFFGQPQALRRVWPNLYAQLARFYRQDPAAWAAQAAPASPG